MSNDTVWRLEPQTRAKHAILRRYLGAWFPILSAQNERIVFFDGFSGPGRYTDGEPGSPVIALETLLAHAYFPKMKNCDFLFLFNEEDSNRFSELESEIERITSSASPWPDNVKIHAVCDNFQSTATELVEIMDEQGKRLAPTFAFVDPFGFKGLSLGLLARLMKSPRCELFILFSFNSLNRWISHPNEKIQNHLKELFGTEDYLGAQELSGIPRKKFLTDLYERQIKNELKLEYVQGFEMVTLENKSYFLFHGTRHIAGVRAMKEAMWNIDPTGMYKFVSREEDEPILFSLTQDTSKEQEQVALHFSGRTVFFGDVEKYVLTKTRLATKHVKKEILRPLQEGMKITCHNQTRKYTYPEKEMIEFH